jgi:hypothetical protein
LRRELGDEHRLRLVNQMDRIIRRKGWSQALPPGWGALILWCVNMRRLPLALKGTKMVARRKK